MLFCVLSDSPSELEIELEIYGTRRKFKQQKPSINSQNRTAYIGETEDQKWLKLKSVQYQNKMAQSDQEEETHRNLVRDMNVFYWQRPQYVNDNVYTLCTPPCI